MPKCSNQAQLKNQEDVKMRAPKEEQKVPKNEFQIIEQKVQLQLDKKDVKLRRVANNPWTDRKGKFNHLN